MLIEDPTVMGSEDQHSTKSLQPWTEQVLRMRYNDIAKLQEGLDEIYGKGQYKLKSRLDRWIVSAHRPLTDEEMQDLESIMYQHYLQ